MAYINIVNEATPLYCKTTFRWDGGCQGVLREPYSVLHLFNPERPLYTFVLAYQTTVHHIVEE